MTRNPEASDAGGNMTAAASPESVAWLAAYTLGIRNTGYNIEPNRALGNKRWRFEVGETEITCSIPIHGDDFPGIIIETAHQIGTPLNNGSRVMLGQKHRFNNDSFWGKKPKYSCVVERPVERLDDKYIPMAAWLDVPWRERLLFGKSDDRKMFNSLLALDRRPVFTVERWKELRGYLKEAIEFRTANESRFKN